MLHSYVLYRIWETSALVGQLWSQLSNSASQLIKWNPTARIEELKWEHAFDVWDSPSLLALRMWYGQEEAGW